MLQSGMLLVSFGDLWRTRPQRSVVGALLSALFLSTSLFADPPASREDALNESVRPFVVLHAELAASAPADQFLMLNRGSTPHVEIVREKNGWLRRMLSGDSYKYSLKALVRSALLHRAPGFEGSYSLHTLNPRKPDQALLIELARRSLESRDISDWWISFSDAPVRRPLKLRRWIVEMQNLFPTIRDIGEVVGEFEMENEDGKVALVRLPVNIDNLTSQLIEMDETQADWNRRFLWRPLGGVIAEVPGLSPSVTVSVHSASVRRDGVKAFGGADGELLEDAIVKMEEETYSWSCWERQQIRDLVRDGSVRVLFAKTETTTNLSKQSVGYLVYRWAADHIEILAVGSRKAYEDLGVVDQLLEGLKGLMDNRHSYIVARLPKLQLARLAVNGFVSWPQAGLAVPATLQDLHRGNAIVGDIPKPLSGEIPVFDESFDAKNVFYLGTLPEKGWSITTEPEATPWIEDVAKASAEASAEANEPLEFLPPKQEWSPDEDSTYEPYDDFFSTFGGSSADYRGMRDNASSSDGEQMSERERAFAAFHKLDFLEHLLHRAVQARDESGPAQKQNQQSIREVVLANFDRRDFENVLGHLYFRVPFEAIVPFLHKVIHRHAGSPEMRLAVQALLADYEKADGKPWHFEVEQDFVAMMERLRAIRRPDLGPCSVGMALRLARDFVKKGFFPIEKPMRNQPEVPWGKAVRWANSFVDTGSWQPMDVPQDANFGAKLRKGISSLAPVSVPPLPQNPKLVEPVSNVLMMHEAADHTVSVRSGKLMQASEHDGWGGGGFYWVPRAEPTLNLVSVRNLASVLWTVRYLQQPEAVKIVPGQHALAGVSHLPEPTAPLYLGFWLLNGVDNDSLIYMVLVSEDPKWHHQVVDAHYLEPAYAFQFGPQDVPPVQTPFQFSQEATDCASLIHNAHRVIRSPRLN